MDYVTQRSYRVVSFFDDPYDLFKEISWKNKCKEKKRVVKEQRKGEKSKENIQFPFHALNFSNLSFQYFTMWKAPELKSLYLFSFLKRMKKKPIFCVFFFKLSSQENSENSFMKNFCQRQKDFHNILLEEFHIYI